MAYIDFKKTNIVVLNGFEAAAYVAGRTGEHFTDTEYEDALQYGLSSQLITPLKEDQFSAWHLEAVGNHYYKVDYLKELADTKVDETLFFVRSDDDPMFEGVHRTFSQDWRIYRTYTLHYIWTV